MTREAPQFGFIAGEVGPRFYGRSDLVKFGFGAKLLQNWIVDERGGAKNRRGWEMSGIVDYTNDYSTQFTQSLARFRHADGDLLAVHDPSEDVMFARDGGFVLETAKSITAITQSTQTTVTVTSHGWAAGDIVYVEEVTGAVELSYSYYLVGAVSTHTLVIEDAFNGASIDSSSYGTFSGTAVISRVYQPASTTIPAGADVEQDYDALIFTAQGETPQRLTYTSDTSWAIADVTFGGAVATVPNITTTPDTSGTAGAIYTVTAVIDGVEGPYGEIVREATMKTTAGSHVEVEWDAVTDAEYYNVYRSLVDAHAADTTKSRDLGWIGRAHAPHFVDEQITADFTKAPPVHYDPFAEGAVSYIEITAGGTGYNIDTTTVTVTGGGGSGFVGEPVVDPAGVIIGVRILNAGSGYSSVTVAFPTGGGSGATATATLTPTGATEPSVFRRFQQRGIYAGSGEYPLVVFGSRSGTLTDFDNSIVIEDSQGFTLEVDEASYNPIKHLSVSQNALLLFTETGVNQLKAEEGSVLTATNGIIEPVAYRGAGDATPINVGEDVLYAQKLGHSLQALLPTPYQRTFDTQDLSTLAYHLVGQGKALTRLEVVEEPEQLVFGLREDGVLLCLAYNRSEEVFGWSQIKTEGFIKDICALRESDGWSLYALIVRKDPNDQTIFTLFLERLRFERPDACEDWVGLDQAICQPKTEFSAEFSAKYDGTDVTWDAVPSGGNPFTNVSVGDKLFAYGGSAKVTSKASADQVTSLAVDLDQDLTYDFTYSGDSFTLRATPEETPYYLSARTTLYGLRYLEGRSISALVDGEEVTSLTVTNGGVTFTSGFKVCAGIPYESDFTSLPLMTPDLLEQGAKKRNPQVNVHVEKTRGLTVGESLTNLYDIDDDAEHGDWDAQAKLRSGVTREPMPSGWSVLTTFSARQSKPYPANILAVQAEVDEGD